MTIQNFKLRTPLYMAARFSGNSSVDDVLAVAGRQSYACVIDGAEMSITIGSLTVRHGEYLVRDPDGLVYVMKQDEIMRKFEWVENL